MMADDKQLLLDNINILGITLDPKAVEDLLHYAAFLREWNERINLISRKDIDNLIPSHIIDSLVALPLFITPSKTEHATQNRLMVMDLGPGGGFPGIPLKLCLPEMELTMVEATQKKATFLELVIPELGLTNTMVIPKHSRELVKDPAHIGKYDIVTARAVSELKDLVKDSFPFLAPGGRLLAYKASRANDEIIAASSVAKKLQGIITCYSPNSVSEIGKQRTIIVVLKDTNGEII